MTSIDWLVRTGCKYRILVSYNCLVLPWYVYIYQLALYIILCICVVYTPIKIYKYLKFSDKLAQLFNVLLSKWKLNTFSELIFQQCRSHLCGLKWFRVTFNTWKLFFLILFIYCPQMQPILEVHLHFCCHLWRLMHVQSLVLNVCPLYKLTWNSILGVKEPTTVESTIQIYSWNRFTNITCKQNLQMFPWALVCRSLWRCVEAASTWSVHAISTVASQWLYICTARLCILSRGGNYEFEKNSFYYFQK